MINILGFVSLPLPANSYTVVSQGNNQFAVQEANGLWISIQPDGSVATRPSNWQLGPYELATFVPAGLRYSPTASGSYLVAAVEV